MQIFSIGHSNRALKDLIASLRAFGVASVADVRSSPKSQHCPHFSRVALEAALPQSGIGYIWLGEGLGGFRRPLGAESPNRGWKDPALQAFADYATTRAFEGALSELERMARESPTAFLCAERMYTKCHRQIIADHLVARGWDVVHIIDATSSIAHRTTPFAKIEGEKVTYPLRFVDRTLEEF
jgi:uncharacterized protein (DUF488 family)